MNTFKSDLHKQWYQQLLRMDKSDIQTEIEKIRNVIGMEEYRLFIHEIMLILQVTNYENAKLIIENEQLHHQLEIT